MSITYSFLGSRFKMTALFLILAFGFFICVEASQDHKCKNCKGYRSFSEEVVVLATFPDRIQEDIPGSIEVISTSQIQEMNAKTAAEALSTAVGMTVSRKSGRMRTPQIRGFGDKHTLILLDSRRLTGGFNEKIDLRQIPVAMIDRIEIIRGPASSLFGSDAMGGVINIITKRPTWDWTLSSNIQYRINRSGEGKEPGGNILFGGYFTEKISFMTAFNFRDNSGWDESGSRPDDGFKEKSLSAMGRLQYNLGETGILSGGFEYIEDDHWGEHDRRNVFQERDYSETRKGYFLRYDSNISQDHKLFFIANRSEHLYDLSFLAIGDPYQGGLRALGDRDAQQYINQLLMQYVWSSSAIHIITTGIEYRKSGIEGTIEEEVPGPQGSSTGLDIPFNESEENFSVFAQNDFYLFENLDMIIGLRYDNHSSFGGQITGRLSASYPLNHNFRLKAGYGHGFSAPTLAQLYITTYKRRGQDEYLNNPDLKAERSRTLEIGFEGNYDSFRFEMMYFHNFIDDLIDAMQLGDNLYQYQNISEAIVKGIEFRGSIHLPHNISLYSNITWTSLDKGINEDESDEGTFNHPEFKGNFKIAYNIPQWELKANIRMSYTGNISYIDKGEEIKNSYSTYDLHLTKGIFDYLDIYGGIHNIFNKQLVRNNVTQIEPTTYYFGLSLNF